MFLTAAYWFFLVCGYFAIGVVYHHGLRKIVNADRWDSLNKKKDESMRSLETEWENRRYLDVALFLMFWPIWIFGGLFVVGLIGNNK